MQYSRFSLGLIALRTSLGLTLIAHSLYLKLVVFTLAGTAQFFGSLGLPPFSAYLFFALEAGTGLALVAGFQVRLAALLTIPMMLGATWVHIGNGWLFTNTGGGWEFPLFLTLSALALFLVYPGKLLTGRASWEQLRQLDSAH